MSSVKFLDFSKLYTEYPELEAVIKRVLITGRLILQEDVESFERKISGYVGKKYAVGLNSGTDAIYLALKAIGVGEGDEVITSAHTFKSTAGAIENAGAKAVLVDIDEYGLMDIQEALNKVTDKTAAIIPVHLTGDFVDKFESPVPVIEDSCQALGATGTGWGVAQAYSFYPAKILGAFGDAGALTTNNHSIDVDVRDARNHYKASNRKYGINSRLDNLQAAILASKIDYLGVDIKKRETIAKHYLKNLTTVILPRDREGRVWQDFIVRHPDRDGLYNYLAEKGIETMKNEYPFADGVNKPPKAKLYESETLRIPCNPYMSEADIDYVTETINLF